MKIVLIIECDSGDAGDIIRSIVRSCRAGRFMKVSKDIAIDSINNENNISAYIVTGLTSRSIK